MTITASSRRNLDNRLRQHSRCAGQPRAPETTAIMESGAVELLRRRWAEAAIFRGMEPSVAVTRAWNEIGTPGDWPPFAPDITPV